MRKLQSQIDILSLLCHPKYLRNKLKSFERFITSPDKRVKSGSIKAITQNAFRNSNPELISDPSVMSRRVAQTICFEIRAETSSTRSSPSKSDFERHSLMRTRNSKKRMFPHHKHLRLSIEGPGMMSILKGFQSVPAGDK